MRLWIAGGILFALLITSSSAQGCDCLAPTVRQAKKHSELTFRGRITGFRDTGKGYRFSRLIASGKAIFRVSSRCPRCRKGLLAQAFGRVSLRSESACSFTRTGWPARHPTTSRTFARVPHPQRTQRFFRTGQRSSTQKATITRMPAVFAAGEQLGPHALLKSGDVAGRRSPHGPFGNFRRHHRNAFRRQGLLEDPDDRRAAGGAGTNPADHECLRPGYHPISKSS